MSNRLLTRQYRTSFPPIQAAFIAVDDVSFSPECRPDPHARLPDHPPECDPDTEYTCDDGTCIPVEKMCDFVNDCPTGDDEETCPSNCDLESGDMCLWTNDMDNDMDWTIAQTDAPPYDHTIGKKDGHFLHLKGNWLIHPKFESILIVNFLCKTF